MAHSNLEVGLGSAIRLPTQRNRRPNPDQSRGRVRLDSNPPNVPLPTVVIDSAKCDASQQTTTPLSAEKDVEAGHAAPAGGDDHSAESSSGRTIYFNRPLPPKKDDPEGKPISPPYYPRNKIRTAKYTPLSFIPKNLWFQFHNIANLYFLLTVILGAFAVFGVVDPALNAAPLIIILGITAVKDAIEDWRRTSQDRELNNAPIHRLVGYNNLNTRTDDIGIWRKVKKGTSRGIEAVWHLIRNKTSKTPRQSPLANSRPSGETQHRSSFMANRLSMQLSRSPNPNDTNPRASLAFNNAARKSVTLDVPADKKTGDRSCIINPRAKRTFIPKFKKDYWKNVQVGDFVRIYDDEEVPADVVILSTAKDDGTCYVETKNLDGETNLKVRSALRCGRNVVHARDCEAAQFEIHSEDPLPNLYAFNGVICWDHSDNPSEHTINTESISINQMLLRGSTLRNSKWILGVVVFTGPETKIMLNSGETPSKRPQLSKDLNTTVIYNFIILFFMCLVAGILNGVNWSKPDNSQNFFEFGSYGNSAAVNGIIAFWAGLILFQTLVPISLYITLDIIRTLQAIFIHNDVNLYYQKLDLPCVPRSWNISDDLGQIEYIFSDKTGTLTQNVMQFKKATINGVPYGKAYTEAQAGLHKRQGLDVEKKAALARQEIEQDRIRMVEEFGKLDHNPYFDERNVTFVSSDCVSHMSGSAGEEQQDAIVEFMLVLALCNTVVPEIESGASPRLDFKAQSPDEAALVATARDYGFSLLSRANGVMTVRVFGVERQYSLLTTIEFNSSRKRMSVIVRMPNKKIVLLCKGADNMIYSRLKAGEQKELRHNTANHLETFAREGLRTLCIAKRELDEDTFKAWKRKHDEAEQALVDRDEKLGLVADEIETELVLLGGTAIEDRLQDGVPESISILAEAGIKLWVLTGDKVGTAINIGYSCNLLNNEMDLIVLKVEGNSIEHAEAELDANLEIFGLTGSDEEFEAAKSSHETPAQTHAIVIDGDALPFVLDDSIKRKFLLLCQQCRSVLCCRVSPAQKAAVVKLVKEGFDCLTLSIGDGANDVAMIQEAHVGIGIAGEEGRAAAMSSDYSIGQFKYLTRILLVHGRWSYRRLSETTYNFFYKNLIWAFSLFWFQIYADFDCQNVFDYTYIILYNLAFTSLPVIFLGVFDQDVSDKVSLVVPQLYRRGIERKEWNESRFWVYMIDGLYQSAVVYFFAYLVFYLPSYVTTNGLDIGDTTRLGVYVAATAVLVSNIYVMMNIYRWDWLTTLITVISVLLLYFWTGVYTAFPSAELFYDAAPQVFGQATFWAMMCVTMVVCLFPRFLAKYVQKTFFPLDIDIIREQVAAGRFNYLEHNDDFLPPPPDSPTASRYQPVDAKGEPMGIHTDLADDEQPFVGAGGASDYHSARHAAHESGSTQYTIPTYSKHAPRDLTQQRTSRTSIESAQRRMEHLRTSMGDLRPSHDDAVTSAQGLHRIESSRCSLDMTGRKLG